MRVRRQRAHAFDAHVRACIRARIRIPVRCCTARAEPDPMDRGGNGTRGETSMRDVVATARIHTHTRAHKTARGRVCAGPYRRIDIARVRERVSNIAGHHVVARARAHRSATTRDARGAYVRAFRADVTAVCITDVIKITEVRAAMHNARYACARYRTTEIRIRAARSVLRNRICGAANRARPTRPVRGDDLPNADRILVTVSVSDLAPLSGYDFTPLFGILHHSRWLL